MISAIVITLNEERNIRRCLGSLSWVEEIVVIDSGSTDATVEIAREHGAKIVVHPYDTDIRQRKRGFDVARGEWLFIVDADEEVPAELAEEIRNELAGPSPAAGYEIARKVSFLGRWILHGGWYPGWSFRLFRADAFTTEDAAVHGGYTTPGEKRRLRAPLHHYSYDSIAHYLEKMNDYTSLQQQNLRRSRPGWAPGPAKIAFSPVSHFLRNYVSRAGYRDGMRGFILAVLDSIYSLGLYSKAWELAMRSAPGGAGGAGEAGEAGGTAAGRDAGVPDAPAPPVTNEEIRALKLRYG